MTDDDRKALFAEARDRVTCELGDADLPCECKSKRGTAEILRDVLRAVGADK